MNMRAFMAWLRARGLSLEGFASETGIGYTTARGWAVDGKKPRVMARMLIRMKFPDCPLVGNARPRAAADRAGTSPLSLKRGVVRRFHGFPDENQNEGYDEHAAMSPEERLELAGFILRQYVVGILNLRDVPRMNRSAVRVVRRGGPHE